MRGGECGRELERRRRGLQRRGVWLPFLEAAFTPHRASVPSPATLRVTVTSVAKHRSKRLKTKILDTIKDAQDVLGALVLLTVRIFEYAHLLAMYGN